MNKTLYAIIAPVGLAALAAVFSISLWADDSEDKSLVFRGIMQELNVEMLEITDGISREDWSQVEEAAAKIADHPRPPMAERSRIMGFAGVKMPQFKNFDQQTHQTAKTLADLARRGEGEAVVDTFAKLQHSCLGCHRTFRESFQEHFYGGGGSQ